MWHSVDHLLLFLGLLYNHICSTINQLFLLNESSVSFALYGRSGNKRSNLNELKFDAEFCEIEAVDFQATSYWPNVGVGTIEKVIIFNLFASA